MNEEMIKRWNAVVSNDDTVYVVGDFCFGKNPLKHFNRLRGNKFLIEGNHDSKDVKGLPWAGRFRLQEVRVDNQVIVLCHYRMHVWNKSHKRSWHLFGHSHCSGKEPNNFSFDVGVDGWNYYPVSFQQVRNKMKWKEYNMNFVDEKCEDHLEKNRQINKIFC